MTGSYYTLENKILEESELERLYRAVARNSCLVLWGTPTFIQSIGVKLEVPATEFQLEIVLMAVALSLLLDLKILKFPSSKGTFWSQNPSSFWALESTSEVYTDIQKLKLYFEQWRESMMKLCLLEW